MTMISLTLVIVLLPVSLFADIYRCVSDNGTVTYSDQPCGKNAEIFHPEYEMSVDDAARRDILKPATDHASIWYVEKDIKDHARHIADVIIPNQQFHDIYITRKGRERDEIPIDWQVTISCGPEADALYSQIKFYYRGKKKSIFSVWLESLKVFSDRQPYDPPAMKDVRRFKKISAGEWKYLR